MEVTQLSPLVLKWRIIGETVEAKWNTLLDFVGDDPELLWVAGTIVVLMTVYWLYAAFFTLMDITNRPKFLRKYKIQPGQNEPVDRKKLISAIRVVLINQVVVSIPAIYLSYHVAFKNYNASSIRILPSLPVILLDIIMCSVLEEIMFYYVHRLMHHKSIYKYVHKKHHEWTAPIAAMTFYCHPIEHLASNLLPIAISVSIVRAHLVTSWIFFTIAIVNSMTDHTGYSFPFSNSSVRFHDYHHAKFNYNFGVLGWLDKLHGTYRESKELDNTIISSNKNNKKVISKKKK